MPDIKNYNDVYQYIADLEAENKKLKTAKFVWMVIANMLRDQLEEVKELKKRVEDQERRITRLEERAMAGIFKAARTQENDSLIPYDDSHFRT